MGRIHSLECTQCSIPFARREEEKLQIVDSWPKEKQKSIRGCKKHFRMQKTLEISKKHYRLKLNITDCKQVLENAKSTKECKTALLI